MTLHYCRADLGDAVEWGDFEDDRAIPVGRGTKGVDLYRANMDSMGVTERMEGLGLRFLGWFKDPAIDSENRWEADEETIDRDTDLYARYEALFLENYSPAIDDRQELVRVEEKGNETSFYYRIARLDNVMLNVSGYHSPSGLPSLSVGTVWDSIHFNANEWTNVNVSTEDMLSTMVGLGELHKTDDLTIAVGMVEEGIYGVMLDLNEFKDNAVKKAGLTAEAGIAGSVYTFAAVEILDDRGIILKDKFISGIGDMVKDFKQHPSKIINKKESVTEFIEVLKHSIDKDQKNLKKIAKQAYVVSDKMLSLGGKACVVLTTAAGVMFAMAFMPVESESPLIGFDKELEFRGEGIALADRVLIDSYYADGKHCCYGTIGSVELTLVQTYTDGKFSGAHIEYECKADHEGYLVGNIQRELMTYQRIVNFMDLDVDALEKSLRVHDKYYSILNVHSGDVGPHAHEGDEDVAEVYIEPDAQQATIGAPLRLEAPGVSAAGGTSIGSSHSAAAPTSCA